MELFVKWSYYSKRSGPMQCKRCQLYGHGANNCNRIFRCNKFADRHYSTECPLAAGPSTGDGKVPDHKLKCANCGGNQAAGFSGCLKRPMPKLVKQATRASARFNIDRSNFTPLPSATPIQGWKHASSVANTNTPR